MFSKIRNNLFLSAHADITFANITSHGITAIVNLSTEVNTPAFDGVEGVKYAFKDDANEAAKHTDKATQIVMDLLQEGHTVLVHCKQGASRSPHIVANVVAKREDRKYDDVYSEVRELHPRAMSYSMGQEIRDKSGGWLGNVKL